MTGLRKLKFMFSVLAFITYGAGIVLIAQNTSGLSIGGNAPYGPLSTPQGGHVFNIRVRANLGISPEVVLGAYFPADMKKSEWKNTTLDVLAKDNSGDICFTMEGNGNKYVEVLISTEHNGTPIEDQYFIEKSQVCKQKNGKNSTGTNSNNVLYAKYPLPEFSEGSVDPITGLYKVTMVIKYGSSASTTYAGHAAFKVNASASKAKLSHANNDLNFPMIGNNASDHEDTEMDLPFALPCSNNNNIVSKTLRIYEADNGLFPKDLKVRVFKTFDGDSGKELSPYETVQFAPGGATDGQYSAANGKERVWFTPDDGSGEKGKVTLNMGNSDKYILRIVNWDSGNAINIGVPGASIYGDEEVCVDNAWDIQGQSTISGVDGTIEAQPGETVRFRHRITNIGSSKSEPMQVEIVRDGGIWTGYQLNPTNINGLDKNEAKLYPGPKGSDGYPFTIPLDAKDGDKYCQYIRWSKDSSANPTSNRTSDDICVVVKVSGEGIKLIKLTPQATTAPEVETQSAISFTGSVLVEDFPQPVDGGWGYDQLVTKPDATQESAVNTGQNVGAREERYVCPAGYSPAVASSNSATACSSSGGTVYVCPNGYGSSANPKTASTKCYRPADTAANGTRHCNGPLGGTYNNADPVAGPQCTKFAEAQSGGTVYTQPTTEYRYRCIQNNAYTSWSSNGASSCNIRYQCEGGASPTGSTYTSPSQPAPLCQRWKCTYAGATNSAHRQEYFNQSAQPNCSYRCKTTPTVWGDAAYHNRNTPFAKDYPGATNNRSKCFVQPSFKLTCRWISPNDLASRPAITVDVKITDQSSPITACEDTAPANKREIGERVCASYAANQPAYSAAWDGTSPLPGRVLATQVNEWRWQLQEGIEGCTNVTGRPYMAVYGGDVKVGGGVVLPATNSCPANAAGIRTYSLNPSNADLGAGAEGGVTAGGVIEQFVSGRFNTNYTDKRKPLTFSNASANGSYGGTFGAGVGCTDFLGQVLPTTQATAPNTTLPEIQLDAGVKDIRRYTGNVYLSGNISTGNWQGDIAKAPLFQLIVEGDIYIGDNVNELDGLYMATGNIYTCATGPGVRPTDTFNNCNNNQLIVNGALAANKIHWLRDCGSVVYAAASDTVPNNPGDDQETCSNQNAAAEIINFSHELWIRSAAPNSNNKYDAISSLPPVL